MSEQLETVPETFGSAGKALILISWGYAVIAAIVTAIVALSVNNLPRIILIGSPSAGRSGSGGTYTATPGVVILVASILVALFAVALVVFRLLVRPGRWWIPVVLFIANVLIALESAAILMAVVLQLGHSAPLSTSSRADNLFPWLIPTTVVVIIFVFVSTYFLLRKLTLGVWRAPSRRRRS
jgi:hypothetical protein